MLSAGLQRNIAFVLRLLPSEDAAGDAGMGNKSSKARGQDERQGAADGRKRTLFSAKASADAAALTGKEASPQRGPHGTSCYSSPACVLRLAVPATHVVNVEQVLLHLPRQAHESCALTPCAGSASCNRCSAGDSASAGGSTQAGTLAGHTASAAEPWLIAHERLPSDVRIGTAAAPERVHAQSLAEQV